MNTMLFGMLNGWEIVLILAVVLVLFGAKKLPELARGLGQGIREFKKSTREVTDELQSAMDAEPPPPPQQKKITEATPSATASAVPQSSPEQKV
jgi:sec-independent protein translocase protein TatA